MVFFAFITCLYSHGFETLCELLLILYWQVGTLKDVRFCHFIHCEMGRRKHMFVLVYQYGTQQQPFHRWIISLWIRKASKRRGVFEERMDSRIGESERNPAVANRRQAGNHGRELLTKIAAWNEAGGTGKHQGDHRWTDRGTAMTQPILESNRERKVTIWTTHSA